MEYIQCPHCNKKYGVNDTIKAAIGKKIRCKQCKEAFEISIQQAPEKKDLPASPKANTELAAPESSKLDKGRKVTKGKKRPANRKAPAKKGFNTQLVISIVLATILITGSAIGLLYINDPGLFKATAKHEPDSIALQPVIPEIDPFAKPGPPAASTEKPSAESASKPLESGSDTDSQLSSADKAAENNPVPTTKKDADRWLDGPEKPTQVCRDAAADHWIRTYKLSHKRMSSEVYMKLFSQGIDQTAEVRKLCRDKTLVVRLTAAAKEENIPDWIKVEVQARTAIDEARRKQVESRKH